MLVVLAGNDKDRPPEIERLLAPIADDGYDFVQGSRYLQGGDFGNMPFYRQLATRYVHPLLFSLIVGRRFTDTTNGFRAIRLSALRDAAHRPRPALARPLRARAVSLLQDGPPRLQGDGSARHEDLPAARARLHQDEAHHRVVEHPAAVVPARTSASRGDSWTSYRSLISPPITRPSRDQIQAAVEKVLPHGKYILGPEVEAFEQGFADDGRREARHRRRHGPRRAAPGLRGGRREGRRRGDRARATRSSRRRWRCRPSARCRCSWTATRSPTTSTSNLIRPVITKKTKAICPVHLYGQAADLDAVLAIAAEYGLKVIEDACQAHGTRYKGRGCGSIGDLGTFSFYPGQEPRRDGRRRHGHDQRRRPRDGGAAAPQLRRGEEVPPRREGPQRAPRHDAGRDPQREAAAPRVGERRTAAAPRGPTRRAWRASRPSSCRRARPTNWRTSITCSSSARRGATNCSTSCTTKGIQTGIHYPIPIHKQPAYAELASSGSRLPVTTKIADEILSLPMFPELTDEQIGARLRGDRGVPQGRRDSGFGTRDSERDSVAVPDSVGMPTSGTAFVRLLATCY